MKRNKIETPLAPVDGKIEVPCLEDPNYGLAVKSLKKGIPLPPNIPTDKEKGVLGLENSDILGPKMKSEIVRKKFPKGTTSTPQAHSEKNEFDLKNEKPGCSVKKVECFAMIECRVKVEILILNVPGKSKNVQSSKC